MVPLSSFGLEYTCLFVLQILAIKMTLVTFHRVGPASSAHLSVET